MAMSPNYVKYLLTQGDLLSRILSFNADFGAKQSSLRAQKENDSIKDSLYKVHPKLAKFHEDNNISYYFENNIDRMCLLRNDELETLLVYLGACICSNQLAYIDNQDEKDLIYNSIGRETYEFALDYGYLIKNLDFMINIDNLKQDCIYLGLCALKSVTVLFSSQQLSEYFVDSLINFAKSIGLDPNIVTSKTHVLSVVYNTADLHQAPHPDMMNNPVQYTPVDNHPKLGKPTALGLALQEFDARAEEERKKADIDTMAILKKARASIKATNMAKAFQERAQLLIEALNANRALKAELEAQERKEQEQKQAQEQELEQALDDKQGDTTDQSTQNSDLDKSSTGSSSSESKEHDDFAFSLKVQSPDRSISNNQEANNKDKSQDTLDTQELASVQTKDHNHTQDVNHQLANTQDLESQSNTDSDSKENKESNDDLNRPLLDKANNNLDELTSQKREDNTNEVASSTMLHGKNNDKTDNLVYGGFSGKDSRNFRVASLRQKSALKDLSKGDSALANTNSNEPSSKEHLVTLDFNEHQVFDLSYLILHSQINENWYTYLKAHNHEQSNTPS